jgi:hypothetical protein
MYCMDKLRGSTVFVFSALVPKDVEEWRGNTGRRICDGIVLPLLSQELVDNAAHQELGDAKVLLHQPRVYRILLQCSGHPRAVFDFCFPAILELHRQFSTDEVPVTAISMQCARASQLLSVPQNLTLQLVIQLISPVDQPDEEVRTALQRSGLLSTSAGIVLPILLREWAATVDEDRGFPWQVKFHLNNALCADDSVGPATEKLAEHLLVHWDAARRLALGARECSLNQLFHGAQIGSSLRSLVVRVCPPAKSSLPYVIQYVSSFAKDSETLDYLRRGCIVVSKLPTESAVEYLAPLWDDHDTLIILGVQVKFQPSGSTFITLAREIETKLKKLQKLAKHGCQVVPLLFTTHHTQHQDIPSNSVCFARETITQYLKPLGPLRLLMEKSP